MITGEQWTTGFRLLLALALAFAVTMALLPQPPQLTTVTDKSQHMAAFATLALLAAGAYPREPLWRIGERLAFLGALIEVFQTIPALHRDAEALDWAADVAAVVVTLILVALLRRVTRSRAAT